MTGTELSSFYNRPTEEILADPLLKGAHLALIMALERGEIRSALPENGEWIPQTWVKQALLIGFRSTQMEPVQGAYFRFLDKTAYPPRQFGASDGVRLVPGGTAVRRGAFVAPGVVVMPPAYINVGAFVDEGTMVDSHALVGSCAQIGKRVHLSAAAQVGGVLEPAGARPVVVEDEAFVGGLCGLFEGVVVRKRAVLASGVIITRSTVLYDLVNEREIREEIPEDAVVVPGSRPASGKFAQERGLALSAPMIVKYRDSKTDAATALEDALR